MTLQQNISAQAKLILANLKQTDQIELVRQKLNQIVLPTDEQEFPIFNSEILHDQKKVQPYLVMINLMVQDIRERQYTYSYLVKKPLKKDSQIIVLKYGLNHTEQIFQKIESSQYLSVMTSGQLIICRTQKYSSQWQQNWNKQQKILEGIKLIVSQKHQFKLGQQIRGICVYNPKNQCLYFLRAATKQQIIKHNLDFQIQPKFLLNNNYKLVKEKVLKILGKVLPQNYSLALLFTIMNPSAYFIDGPNIAQLLKEILPRVCHIQIKAPFKQSMFPYKNSQGQLIDTEMQLSSHKSFIILDFSQLTEKNQIKICSEQIDNLKALKIFVEQGQCVYRWQFGESLFPHKHSGIIVKGSSILTPHFKFQKSLTENKFENHFLELEENEKWEIRAYFEQCRNFDPKLDEENRDKIETLIKQEMEKNPEIKLDIQNRILFAKMNAMSEGRQLITIDDYQIGRRIVINQ